MAFWRAPWNGVFAPRAEPNDDEFSIVDAADATSQFGVKSVHSEPCTGYDITAHGNSCEGASTWSGCTSAALWDAAIDLSCYDKFPLEDESLLSALSRQEAVSLEMAGRHNDGHMFQDLRSGAKPRRRLRTDLQKYYGYRAVNRGQLDVQHKVQPTNFTTPRSLPSDLPTHIVNKKDLFSVAQDWPRPPSYHKRPTAKKRWPFSLKYEARRDARKHAKQEWDVSEEMSLAYDIDGKEARFSQEYDRWLEIQRERYAELQDLRQSESQAAGPSCSRTTNTPDTGG